MYMFTPCATQSIILYLFDLILNSYVKIIIIRKILQNYLHRTSEELQSYVLLQDF